MTKPQFHTIVLSLSLLTGLALFANPNGLPEDLDDEIGMTSVSFGPYYQPPAEDLDVQALLQDYIEVNGGIGGAVCVIDHGQVQFYTYGNQSLSGSDPITESTVFELGSLTKVFTTLALVNQVSKGDIQLNDPIDMYLPGVNVPEMDGNKILLHHLATHTSGLPHMPSNFAPQDPTNPFADYTTQKLYDFLNECALKNAPGTSFNYSNVGVALLGHALCQRSGQTYDALLHGIIDPLGMQSTSISLTPEMAQNFADGHQWHQKIGHWDFATFEGMGGIRSTIYDMSLFLSACMGVTPSRISEMLQFCEQKVYALTPTLGIGLAWLISTENDSQIIWHNGSTGGFKSYLGFNPGTQRGVVILANGSEAWPDELALHLLNPSYQPLPIDKALASSPEYLAQFLGSYEATASADHPKQELHVYSYGKLLVLVMPQNEIAMLYPESFGVFGVKGYSDTKICFSFDTNKSITKIEAVSSDGKLLWEAPPKPS